NGPFGQIGVSEGLHQRRSTRRPCSTSWCGRRSQSKSPAAGRNIGWAGLAAVKGLAAFRLEPDRQTDRSNHDQNELGQTKLIHDSNPSGPAPFGGDCSSLHGWAAPAPAPT